MVETGRAADGIAQPALSVATSGHSNDAFMTRAWTGSTQADSIRVVAFDGPRADRVRDAVRRRPASKTRAQSPVPARTMSPGPRGRCARWVWADGPSIRRSAEPPGVLLARLDAASPFLATKVMPPPTDFPLFSPSLPSPLSPLTEEGVLFATRAAGHTPAPPAHTRPAPHSPPQRRWVQ